MVETFTALAEPSRLRIVEYLRAGPRPVGAISSALQLAQPQVSKHLRVLKQARLVDVEPRAQQRLYALRPEPLRELGAWIERYRTIWEERLDNLDALVAELEHGRSTSQRTTRTTKTKTQTKTQTKTRKD